MVAAGPASGRARPRTAGAAAVVGPAGSRAVLARAGAGAAARAAVVVARRAVLAAVVAFAAAALPMVVAPPAPTIPPTATALTLAAAVPASVVAGTKARSAGQARAAEGARGDRIRLRRWRAGATAALRLLAHRHRAARQCARDRHDRAGLDQHGAGARRAAARGDLGDPLGGARRSAARREGHRPAEQRRGGERGGGGPQRRPRPVHEPAHRALAQPELGRHLLLRAALDGRAQERLALRLGQRREPGQRPAHHPSPLVVLGGSRQMRPERLLKLVVLVALHPQRVERGVLGDPVQPRPRLAHLDAALKRRPGVDERLLHRVLGARLRQQLADVPVQRLAVAVDQRLERALVPFARELDQALVALRPQDRMGEEGAHPSPPVTRARAEPHAASYASAPRPARASAPCRARPRGAPAATGPPCVRARAACSSEPRHDHPSRRRPTASRPGAPARATGPRRSRPRPTRPRTPARARAAAARRAGPRCALRRSAPARLASGRTRAAGTAAAPARSDPHREVWHLRRYSNSSASWGPTQAIASSSATPRATSTTSS